MRNLYFTTALMMMAVCAPASALDLHVGYSADDIASKAGGLSTGTYIAGAMKIPAELARQYEGNSITGIDVGYGSASTKSVTLFISENLGEAPVYTQSATIDKVSHWTEFDLSSPYEIDGSKDIYVGYYVRINSARDYPIGCDNLALLSDNGDFMSVAASADELWGKFEDQSSTFGNLCVRARISGESLPAELAQLQGMVVSPNFVLPGDKFDISTAIVNWGDEPLKSAEISCRVGDDDPIVKEFSFSMGIENGELRAVSLNDLVTWQDRFGMPVEITLTKVNGKTPVMESTYASAFDCTRNAYRRNVVVEEGTGTWCGNCPIGYVGLEYMREHYPDGSFIGIAVHNNDAMEVSEYDMFMGKYIAAYPQCVVNRESKYTGMMPSFSTLESVYKDIYMNNVAYEKVEVVSEVIDGNMLRATATVNFIKDYPDNDFAISFVLTEDGVGPYRQSNAFASKSSNGMATEFESMSAYVSLVFNDVARYISSTTGHEGSIPANVEKGGSYTYSLDLPLSNCTDISNVHVIALLTDRQTGTIINAATNKAGCMTGIEEAVADIDENDCPTEYYTLQGVRVAEPGSGIYIVRKGSSVRKVIINN